MKKAKSFGDVIEAVERHLFLEEEEADVLTMMAREAARYGITLEVLEEV